MGIVLSLIGVLSKHTVLFDEIQTKVLSFFLLAIHSQFYMQLCLEICISLNSRNLLSISSNSHNLLPTVQLLYTVK
jgi:hypothetical protein